MTPRTEAASSAMRRLLIYEMEGSVVSVAGGSHWFGSLRSYHKKPPPKTANMKSHWASEGACQLTRTFAIPIPSAPCFITNTKTRTIVGKVGKNKQITKTAVSPARTLLK